MTCPEVRPLSSPLRFGDGGFSATHLAIGRDNRTEEHGRPQCQARMAGPCEDPKSPWQIHSDWHSSMEILHEIFDTDRRGGCTTSRGR